MNNNTVFAFFLSIAIHGAMIIVPFRPDFFNIPEMNVIQGPSSVEISMVHTVAPVIVKPENVEEEIKEDKKKKKEIIEEMVKEEEPPLLKKR